MSKKETNSNVSIKINEEKKTLIISGILSQNVDKAGYKGKGGVKRNISVKMEKPLSEEERETLAKLCSTTKDDKYCPHAIKEEKEFFTVKTMYDIPIRIDDKINRNDLEDFGIDANNPTLDDIGLGSSVHLACKCKENAIYPTALVVDELKVFNPFEMFE